MILEKSKVYKIEYKKANGEIVNREVLILKDAPKNVMTYDLTTLNALQRKVLLKRQREYLDYVEEHMKKAFKFEDWYDHTYGEKFPGDITQFKAFTVDNILTLTEQKDD